MRLDEYLADVGVGNDVAELLLASPAEPCDSVLVAQGKHVLHKGSRGLLMQALLTPRTPKIKPSI